MIDPEVRESMEMIRDSAGGIAGSGDLSRVRGLRFTEPGYDRTVWQDMCDMGWPALRVPESEGGAGLGMLPYCALAEELGRGLVPEPFISAVLATSFLKGEDLARQISGDALYLPAWQDDRASAAPLAPLDVTSGTVTCVKRYVPQAAGADAFVLIGTDAIAVVPAQAPGVTVRPEATQDGGSMATVTVRAAPADRVPTDPTPALAEACLATSAYLLGMIDAALAMTVAYLKTRVQFGKTIGNFQILQHMAVDMKLEAALTRACIENAASRWDREGATAGSAAAIARTSVRARCSAMKVTRDAVQLHGGIGYTDEHDIGLYLRKAMVVASQQGGVHAHRTIYSNLQSKREEV